MNRAWVENFLICFIVALCISQWVGEFSWVNPPQGRSAQDIFKPARPWLYQVPQAGFYSESYDPRSVTDVHFAWHYQWAQFALSPTLLDYEHPLIHSRVIAYMDQGNWDALKRSYPWKDKKALGNNFYLLIR